MSGYVRNLINTAVMICAFAVNYWLLPGFFYSGDRFMAAFIVIGVFVIAGTVFTPKMRYWLIPDAVHILVLWGAVKVELNGNPYNLGLFFGWSSQMLMIELILLLVYIVILQALTIGVIFLIKTIKKHIGKTHTEKGDDIGQHG